MEKRTHVEVQHYLLLLRGAMTSGEMLKRVHRHVLEGCESCRASWQELVQGERADIGELLTGETEPISFDPTPPAETPLDKPSPYQSAFSGAAKRLNRAAIRLTREKRQARRELEKLLAVPAGEREEMIVHARTRFRSPALAHLLLEQARERVRRSWRESLELLDLLRLVLLWSPEAGRSDWGRSLALRADAHRANAHRVAGDLPEADRRFRALRRQLVVDPVADPSLDAEVASLEASLRWDQRRLDDAMALLDQAAWIYGEVAEREGLARVLIKRASVAQELERSEQALADLDRARRLVDRHEQPFLYLFTVVGSAPILIDRGRCAEAESLLSDAAGACEAAAEPWWAHRLAHLQGRAALGGGDLERAERLLSAARQDLIDRELPKDTANATLDLALVHLQQGRTGEVRRLCAEIAPYLEACGAAASALAALALLGRATAADAAALAQVAKLRRHLQATCPRRAEERQPS